MGRPRTSRLAPFFRSEAQARILAAVFLSPEAAHLRRIAEKTDLPYSVVQREIDRLETDRLVSSTRFATSRLVRPNEKHPLFPELRALLLKAYGPQHALGSLLRDESGVRDAYVFGSWAARYHGDWNGPWADVDVAIVGAVSPSRQEELEVQAEDLLGWPVQVVVIPPKVWENDSDSFVRTVRSRPLVPVDLKGST